MSYKEFMDDYLEDILDYIVFDLIKYPIEESETDIDESLIEGEVNM